MLLHGLNRPLRRPGRGEPGPVICPDCGAKFCDLHTEGDK